MHPLFGLSGCAGNELRVRSRARALCLCGARVCSRVGARARLAALR